MSETLPLDVRGFARQAIANSDFDNEVDEMIAEVRALSERFG